MSELTFANGCIVMKTPFDRGLLNEMKIKIPSTERNWNRVDKVWELDPKHGQMAADLIMKRGYFNQVSMLRDTLFNREITVYLILTFIISRLTVCVNDFRRKLLIILLTNHQPIYSLHCL